MARFRWVGGESLRDRDGGVLRDRMKINGGGGDKEVDLLNTC